MARMKKWVNVEIFAEKYGIDKDYLHVHLHNHKKDRDKAIKKEGGFIYVDENYFASRRDFRSKVLSEAHSYYYFFEEYFGDLNIARSIHAQSGKSSERSINHFFQNGFRLDESSIFNYEVPPLTWMIWRSLRHMVMQVMRIRGIKIPKGKRLIDVVEKVLDNRAYNNYRQTRRAA